MYCPDCGLEDKQANQFCRACGTDLRPVRYAIETPDRITASASSAREEIGRVFAAKIRDARHPEELSVVAEDVLPELEKFLESPEEKRMRRMRVGTLLAGIGMAVPIGVALITFFIPIKDFEAIFMLSLGGVVTFFLGLAFIVNGILLTVPKKGLADRSSDADRQRALDGATTSDLVLPEASSLFSSVTDHTTRHLKEKQPAKRD